jgi:small subunit ribosomal protein S4
MGRYTDPKCRLCRREGAKLFLKGDRCASEKCAFQKRTNPPGMHTRPPSKPSYYSMQLREKQKVKRTYGMLEKQFKRFFRTASKAKGVTGRKLIELLERRIDNVIYRTLFAGSRAQARQLVAHGLVHVNGKRINVPSAWVDEGDTLEIKGSERLVGITKEAVKVVAKSRSVPTWLNTDNDNLKATVVRLPAKEDLVLQMNEQLIIELYSK